jgi:hypothetical protein
MNDSSPQAHWESVYTSKGEKEVSWYQDSPTPSLDLIALTGLSGSAEIIDIGGGASRLLEDDGTVIWSGPELLIECDARKERMRDRSASASLRQP